MVSPIEIVLAASLMWGGTCDVTGRAAVAACEEGLTACCQRAAIFLLFPRRMGPCEGNPDPLRAVMLLQVGCRAEDAGSCLELGLETWRAQLPAMSEAEQKALRLPTHTEALKFWDRGERLIEAGCERGEPNACFDLVALVRRGFRRHPDEAYARIVEERARGLLADRCKEGDRAACEDGARRDLRVGRNIDVALDVLSEVCNTTAGRLCEVEVDDRVTKLTDRQTDRIEKMLRHGCLSGFGSACRELARRAKLRGAAGQWAHWTERDCRLGNGYACHELADKSTELVQRDEWRRLGCASGAFHSTCPQPPAQCPSPTPRPPDKK